MKNGISRLYLLSSLALISCLYFGTLSTVYAQGIVKGCAIKYYEAAKALDEKRAQCGIAENGSGFCQIASQTDIPVSIQGFNFTLNAGFVYRFLSSLKIIPNQFRRAAKLIQEAQGGTGPMLKRAAGKIARHIPGSNQAVVAKIISEANMKGSLCSEDHFLTVKEIGQLVEEEIVRL